MRRKMKRDLNLIFYVSPLISLEFLECIFFVFIPKCQFPDLQCNRFVTVFFFKVPKNSLHSIRTVDFYAETTFKMVCSFVIVLKLYFWYWKRFQNVYNTALKLFHTFEMNQKFMETVIRFQNCFNPY